MERRKLLGLLAMVACLLLTGCPPRSGERTDTGATVGQNGTPPSKTQVVHVGAIMPLTGPLAAVGEAQRHGMELGVEDANADLAEAGSPYRLNVTYEDFGGEPKNAVAAAQKLLADGVDAVIAVYVPATRAVLPIVTGANKPLISLSVDPKVQEDSPLVYRLFYGSDQEAEAMVAHFERHRLPSGAKLGALYFDHAGTLQEVNEYLKPGLERIGVKLAMDEKFPPGTKDFKPFVSKIKQAGLSHLITIAYSVDYAAILRDMASLEAKPEVLGNFGLITAYKLTPEQKDGLLAAVPAYLAEQPEPFQAFQNAYQTRFGGSDNHDAPMHYNAIRMLGAALSTASAADGQALAQSLDKLQAYDGILGRVELVERALKVPMAVGQFEGGNFRALPAAGEGGQ